MEEDWFFENHYAARLRVTCGRWRRPPTNLMFIRMCTPGWPLTSVWGAAQADRRGQATSSPQNIEKYHLYVDNLYSALGGKPGENVLDLFGGSGSTLIAAHHTGRRAFLMEIDPPYCDVIVERWENVTGQKAKRIPAPNPSPGRKPKVA
jgi:hypothetical protein